MGRDARYNELYLYDPETGTKIKLSDYLSDIDCEYDCDGDCEHCDELCEEEADLVLSLQYFIKDVIFRNPATIVKWEDGTKTVVKCRGGDAYNKEFGLLACIVKKFTGNDGRWNKILKVWCDE